MMETLWAETAALPPARSVTPHNSQGFWKLSSAKGAGQCKGKPVPLSECVCTNLLEELLLYM